MTLLGIINEDASKQPKNFDTDNYIIVHDTEMREHRKVIPAHVLNLTSGHSVPVGCSGAVDSITTNSPSTFFSSFKRIVKSSDSLASNITQSKVGEYPL